MIPKAAKSGFGSSQHLKLQQLSATARLRLCGKPSSAMCSTKPLADADVATFCQQVRIATAS